MPPTRCQFHPRRAILTLSGIVLAAVVCGCAPGTPPVTSPVELPASFATSGAIASPDRWWTAFADSSLAATIERALRDNLDLKTAWERLREAEATVAIAGGGRYPLIEADLVAETRRSDAVDTDRWGLGLGATYEVDLWGRVGAEVAAERLRARATLADYRAAALSLSAEAALARLRLIEALAQRDLLARQAATNETSLTLLEARFGTGLVRSADILRQRQLLEATREQLLAADSRIAILRHRLAVLLGQPPATELDTVAHHLPALPPLPAAGVPADLVTRRPDVQRAHHLLAAADRDLAAAISNRYPRLSITGSVSTEAASASDLFDDWLRSLAANLLVPIFSGGELSAQVDRAEARRGQRLHEYGQTVLTALAEVEDALALERALQGRRTSIAQQVEFAAETFTRLRLEFFNGLGGYLDVLTAQTVQQRLERDLLSIELALLENRITLYRALAGGVGDAADQRQARR